MRIAGWILVAGGLCASPLAAQTPQPPTQDTTKPKPPPRVDISKLKFMSGCWEGPTGKDQRAEEIWTMPAENLLVSTTRYFEKDRALGYDFNRIEVTDSGVVLGITAKGKPEETYLMKTLVDEYVVFENFAKKDFPQRIMYRLASDGALIPRNEGDGPSFEVRFRRIKCPGADIKLRP
ncbi:MAG TPA: DUF6265 family protein [Gemmatimonadales bacterium]|jgi:uncharacterized protein DUF6265